MELAVTSLNLRTFLHDSPISTLNSFGNRDLGFNLDYAKPSMAFPFASFRFRLV
jgi:hypothetical protein